MKLGYSLRIMKNRLILKQQWFSRQSDDFLYIDLATIPTRFLISFYLFEHRFSWF